jgi:hypothetical protein
MLSSNGQAWAIAVAIAGFASAIQGAFIYLLFKGFAEVIRLLRKK